MSRSISKEKDHEQVIEFIKNVLIPAILLVISGVVGSHLLNEAEKDFEQSLRTSQPTPEIIEIPVSSNTQIR